MAKTVLTQHSAIGKFMEEHGGDALRTLLQNAVQKLMSAEVDSLCKADFGSRDAERINRRNGYRERPWDTRMGSVDLQVPKLRAGSYYPEWLLEPRRRAERALHQVISECYLLGVSTRRVDGLVKTLGIDKISKSQVSLISQELDQRVEEFRSRSLDGSPYPYVWVDALYIKCREGGRVAGVAVAVATGVNQSGAREILGLDVFTSEDAASWLTFLRDLSARGLSGVQLIISDCHQGLKQAIEAVYPSATWQRCRTHFMRNLLTHVPKHMQDMVASIVRTIYAQSDATTTRAQYERVINQLRGLKMAKCAQLLENSKEDLLAFCGFPKTHWRQIWSNNPQERLNREIRRRTDVVGIFPNREAIIRLVGALLSEQNDEWQVCRRYMRFTDDQRGEIDTAALNGQITEAEA
jgi:putative transposase